MDNKINFTGLQNMGGAFLTLDRGKGRPIRTNMLLANLTDNFDDKDLTEYTDVLNKCGLGQNYEFKPDRTFIHLLTQTGDSEFSVPKLYLNQLEVVPQKKTMPLFTYLAKLTKKIINMEDKDFFVTDEFKFGSEGDSYVIPGKSIMAISAFNGIDNELMLNQTYSPLTSRIAAQKINNDIQSQMVDYFA